VPLFFVVAGSRLDLASVAANPWGPVVCLAGILVIRGLPQWLLYRRTLPDPIERLRFSLLVSQSLNLPIVVAYLEVQAGLMSPEVGAALLGGSLLSVLVLPALALAIKR
jgi:Kef-type K+ transport system membrane component KefB